MKNLLKLQVVILSCLFCLTGALAADEEVSDGDYIWKSGLNLYFKYADQRNTDFGPNNHPVVLKQDQVNEALKLLIIKETTLLGGEVLEPLFSVQQMRTLAESLTRGLAKARPDQDIVFVMQKASKKLIFLDEQVMLAGRAFYKDDKLNIIIGSYDVARNEAFEAVYDPSGQGNVPYSLHHGQRSSSSNFNKEVENAPGIVNKFVNGKLRRDWFTIDVAVAAQASIAKANDRGNQSGQVVDDKAIRLEAARLAKERRELRMEMARMRKEMQENGNSSEGLTIEERLAQLDDLRQKELISKEEYEQKREEILNDI